jgi:hypothetical protein
VKDIQEEYQKFMEQVRTKAQGAIDEVNQAFESARDQWSGGLEGSIRELDKQFYNVLQQPAAGQDVRPS